MPRTIIVGPYLRDRAEVLAEALSERRGAPVEVRAAERGDKRRLRELAERNAQLALDQDRLRREHRRQRRVEALAALRRGAGDGASCRCGSRASTSRRSAASTPSPRWSSSRAARRRSPTTAASKSAATCARTESATAAPTTSPRWRRCSRGGWPATSNRPTSRRTTRKRDASFASLPSLILIDGGKGQLAAGVRALRAVHRARRHRRQPRQAAGGGLRPRPLRAARPRRRLGGLAAAAAGPRRGAPVRDRPPPRPPRPRHARRLGPRRAARDRARRASARCCSTSARRSGSSPPPARSSRQCPACLAK